MFAQNGEFQNDSENSEITYRTEIVTPEMAVKYLSNQNINRAIGSAYVKRLANDMIAGLWVANSEPLKFDKKGKLIDGQHRLQAVVLSCIEQSFIILSGYNTKAMSVIDIGKCRSSANIGQIQGLNINNNHTSCVNALQLPNKMSSSFSKVLIVEVFKKFEKSIRFVIDRPLTDLRMPAVLSALLAKAYYYENHHRLDEFINVYGSGMAIGEHDWAAIALRNHFLKLKENDMFSMTYDKRVEIYLKSQNALTHFLNRNAITTIQKPRNKTNNYPLPTIDDETTEVLRRLKQGNFDN